MPLAAGLLFLVDFEIVEADHWQTKKPISVTIRVETNEEARIPHVDPRMKDKAVHDVQEVVIQA